MSEILVNTIKKADGTGSLTVPAETGTVLTSATNIVTNYGPLFRAARGPSSNQTVSHNTITKVQFDVDVVDTDNCYDNTTNYRFTPTTAGYYYLNLNIIIEPPSSSNFLSLAYIYKNGSRQILTEKSTGSVGSGRNQSHSVSLIAEANGTTDYFEGFVYHFDYSGSGSAVLFGAADYRNCNFQGYLVRAL